MPDADDLSSVQRWRTEVHRGWLHGDPSPEQLGFEELVVGGVRCLAKDTGRDGATVIYAHGGGFCLGNPEVVLPITSRLAGSSEAEDAIRLVSVDYRLAPEHPYPAAVEDVAAVVRVNAEEQPGRPIVLVGDSAGANIALAVSVAATDVPLAGVVLLSPHVDLRGPDAASQNLDPLSDVDEDGSRWLTDAYRAGVAPEDPQISPLLADLRSLPPLLIQAGTRDNTMQAAVRLARRARRVGVPVTLDLWDGLWHTWHYHRELPEADAALLEVRRFIGERVAATINR
jgi:acetyl esterase/lipase